MDWRTTIADLTQLHGLTHEVLVNGLVVVLLLGGGGGGGSITTKQILLSALSL